MMGVRRPSRRSERAYPKYGTTATIRAASARRHASASASNSTRWSLTGGAVAASRKTSSPRTGSSSRTDTSPSGNRSIVAAAKRRPRSCSTRAASDRLAEPAMRVAALVPGDGVCESGTIGYPAARNVKTHQGRRETCFLQYDASGCGCRPFQSAPPEMIASTAYISNPYTHAG